MSKPQLRISVLADSGDQRGSSFKPGITWLQFLKDVADTHITTLLPGHVRGNHYHVHRREVLVVLFMDEWQLSWDEGAGTNACSRGFSGTGVAVVEIDPLASHAVANTGHLPLWIVGLSNGVWDAKVPDSHPRKVF
jgi:hypothetical protein